MWLCFSQAQAAAVYAATKGADVPVYVLPFIGRLDGIGKNGMDLIKNIQRMFAKGDGHILILAASIRSREHLLCCFFLETELATVPAKSLRHIPIDSCGGACPYPDVATRTVIAVPTTRSSKIA
jgi:transaldolase